jgi:hypothetical protein
MVQKVVTSYTDDLTGEESDEISTYTVTVNGVGVRIDLTPDSFDKLMEALRPFLRAPGARRVREGKTLRERRGRRNASGRDVAAIRVGPGKRVRGQQPRAYSGPGPRSLRARSSGIDAIAAVSAGSGTEMVFAVQRRRDRAVPRSPQRVFALFTSPL